MFTYLSFLLWNLIKPEYILRCLYVCLIFSETVHSLPKHWGTTLTDGKNMRQTLKDSGKTIGQVRP